jgi:hypothetical protein
MEGLGVAANVIAVVTLAIQSAQWIVINIDTLKDVPANLKSVNSDIQTLLPLLQIVDEKFREARPGRWSEIEPAVNQCLEACSAIQVSLKNWIKRSDDPDTPGKRDTLSLGLRRNKQILALRNNLNGAKQTLLLALVASQL